MTSSGGIKERVGESANQPPSNSTKDELTRVRKVSDASDTLFNFVEESRCEAWACQIIEDGGVHQFTAGQAMKGDLPHSL